MSRLFFRGAVVLGALVFAAGQAKAGYVVTANAAGSQSSTVSGVTTETFDSFSTGRYTSLSTAVGTLASTGLQIVPKDQYSGAGGVGNYFSVGAQSGQLSATLTLNGPQSYFGFWWSAADPLNELTFLSKGQVVATFDSAAILGKLSASYLGNPNGGDSGEKFAYLNFISTGGMTFDQIVFANQSTGTGFESDNWSVRSAPLDGPYPGVTLASVPEPSSLALTGMGIAALAGVGHRRRRQVS